MRRAAVLGIVLGTLLSAATPSEAAWLRASGGQHASGRYTTWACTGGAKTNQVFFATGDTEARADVPDTNFGSSAGFSIGGSSNGSNERIALVQFTYSIPAGCSITSASLQLTKSGTTGGGKTIQVRRVTQAWAEGTVTWNTFPLSSSVNQSSFTVSGSDGGGMTATLDPSIVTPFGFRLRDPSLNSIVPSFRSRESNSGTSDDPKLVLSWS